jgi:thioredoxin reductase/NAD-dependent dihydropyrimidine dehydrogenase PreA subunit
MDFLTMMVSAEVLIYSGVGIFCLLIILIYVWKGKKESEKIREKVELAKEEGRFVPQSLHPYIDLDVCIGSGACVKACPEKDILGIMDSKATVINATSCVGHGACFHACPVEAISLRIGTEQRGVDLPHVNQNYETNVKGIYIAGELGGMGLIKNSAEQGKQAVENIAKSGKPQKEGILDLIIIGAGPAGIAGSLTAKKLGLDFLTLEQDSLGGTVFTFPRAKIVMTNPMELPLYGKVKLYDTSKDELLDLWMNALGKNDIQIREHCKVEKITFAENEVFKILTATGEEFLSNHVLIAIGRRGSPRKLNIPGENSKKVAYRLLEPENISGKKIMIVGGGDSAIESAMLLMEQNEVILSYRKDRFARIKPKNSEKINRAMTNQKLKVIFNSNLVKIDEAKVELKVQVEDGETVQQIENDLVYIFAGGELPIKFLQNAGIEISKKFGKIVKSYK